MATKEYLELNEESRVEQARHAETLRQYEIKKRARGIIVPTAVNEIKTRLRELGHPVTLFGEDHADRRERLREIIAKLELSHDEAAKIQELLNKGSAGTSGPATSTEVGSKPINQKEVNYSQGNDLLTKTREIISKESFHRCQQRLIQQRKYLEDEEYQQSINGKLIDLYQHNRELILNLSQIGDDRPLSAVRCSGDGQFIASSSLNPTVKIFQAETLEGFAVLKGHTERVTGVHWASATVNRGQNMLVASSSADGSCIIWDLTKLPQDAEYTSNHDAAMEQQDSHDMEEDDEEDNDDDGDDMDEDHAVTTTTNHTFSTNSSSSNHNAPHLLHRLSGHFGVVSACEFHPFHSVVATACHDFAYRLFDLETAKELQLQDGHIKECTALAFHVDGSLLMTGDAGGVGLLWDIRSGQMITALQGHSKKITSIAANANGYQFASSSSDHSVKVWDIRKKKCFYTLPAHGNIISDVRYSPSGEFLLSASFDSTVKLWSSRDFQLLRSLNGHNNKVMSCDFHPDEKHLFSAGYDRSIKYWAHRDEF